MVFFILFYLKGQFKQLILWFSKQMSSIWTFKCVCVCVEEDTKGKRNLAKPINVGWKLMHVCQNLV